MSHSTRPSAPRPLRGAPPNPAHAETAPPPEVTPARVAPSKDTLQRDSETTCTNSTLGSNSEAGSSKAPARYSPELSLSCSSAQGESPSTISLCLNLRTANQHLNRESLALASSEERHQPDGMSEDTQCVPEDPQPGGLIETESETPTAPPDTRTAFLNKDHQDAFQKEAGVSISIATLPVIAGELLAAKGLSAGIMQALGVTSLTAEAFGVVLNLKGAGHKGYADGAGDFWQGRNPSKGQSTNYYRGYRVALEVSQAQNSPQSGHR